MEAIKGTIGRKCSLDKEESLIKDPFLMDYFKILKSKSYRRLAYKTQVISAPRNPHIRTRRVHTDEVITFSLAISEALGLKKTLCQAIAAGHDIGHTPYGHLGESVLSEFAGRHNGFPKPFLHHIYSVVVAQDIERKAEGLNLTYETLDGIMHHSGFERPECNKPEEYFVVMYADTIAYTIGDLNDGIRYGYFEDKDIRHYKDILGDNAAIMSRNVIKALVDESIEANRVQFTHGDVYNRFVNLKNFLMSRFYQRIDHKLHAEALESCLDFFSSEVPEVDPVISVSLMTDNEVSELGKMQLDSIRITPDKISHFGVFEILPYIKNKEIDYTSAGLEWGENLKGDAS
ncbi:HD domain-containing protein [Candidatus Woesearchaeota archaeon]|nr:HD domain-containing protein [Candidatus Woesearchaeota archaeon]